MDLLLTIQRDRSIKHLKLQKKTADLLSTKFNNFATALRGDEIEIFDFSVGFNPGAGEVQRLKFRLPETLSRFSRALPNGVAIVDEASLKVDPPIALVGVDVGTAPRFCFQAVDNRNMLVEGRAVFFDPKGFKFNESTGILVGGGLDAMHEGGYLYFRSEHKVRRFLDIDRFFRAASDEEIGEFFSSKTFIVDDWEALKAAATTLLRRKLHAVLTDPAAFTTEAIQEVGRRVNISIQLRAGAIVVPTDRKGFREFVRIIDDDFLESVMDHRRLYFTNSKRLVAGRKK
jgi:hypothetical protein